MRRLPGLSLAVLLAFSAGSFAQQQSQPNACRFTVQASSTRPEITGPPDMVPLVYVVEHPDSPIEILSINLDGTWLSFLAIAIPNAPAFVIRFAIAATAQFSILNCCSLMTVVEVPEHLIPRPFQSAKLGN